MFKTGIVGNTGWLMPIALFHHSLIATECCCININRNLDRDAIIKKWEASGLLEGIDNSKQSIAALYESQARQLLK